MDATRDDLDTFRRQLEQGALPRAYRALVTFMLDLRAHSASSYAVSRLYQGYLDMTYFALFPPALKQRDLKIAIVFNYAAFRFEAWLAASNRTVQRHTWELFQDGSWAEYRLVAPAKGIDSILECDLAPGSALADPGALTARIETATATFIAAIERYLSERQPAKRLSRPAQRRPG